MKLLTVTIPCYNSQEYMEHAINSALIGGDDIEIIIVDDGSSDKTLEIARQYEEKYPTIVRAIHKENGGPRTIVIASIISPARINPTPILYVKCAPLSLTKYWHKLCKCFIIFYFCLYLLL